MRWKWISTVTWVKMIFSSIPLRNAIWSVLSLLLVKSHNAGNMANITHLTNSKIRTGLKLSVVCQIMLDFDRRLSALEKVKLNIRLAFLVRIVSGTSWPGYELSWVRFYLGTSCLGMSVVGTRWPKYELSSGRDVLGVSCRGYKLSRFRSKSYFSCFIIS